MLQLLISILGILITILFVVGTHEAAHFSVAKLLGVKVLRFSIGFGKTLLRFHDKKGTEYVLALIPLGGYVKMLDENEGQVSPEELPLAFNRQPFYKKFLIVLAGPACNLVCALILYWLIFVIGFVTIKPIIGEITPHSIAAAGGLKPNQQIVSINGQTTSTWPSIMLRLVASIGSPTPVKMETKNSDEKLETHYLDLSQWQINGLNPDPMASLGLTPYEPPIPLIIGVMAKNSKALTSKLKIGDKIIAINKKPVKDWGDLITTIYNHPDETLLFTIERDHRKLDIPVTIGSKRDLLWTKYGYLGIGPHFDMPPNLLHRIQYSPLTAISYAWQQITDFTYFNLLLFWKMSTGKLSLQSLGGPITIFESAGQALNYGFISFIGFLAFLSVAIGVINILPIPGLDGGHIFIQMIEAVIRRPLPEKIIILLYRLGFLFIFAMMLIALTNDILRMHWFS